MIENNKTQSDDVFNFDDFLKNNNVSKTDTSSIDENLEENPVDKKVENKIELLEEEVEEEVEEEEELKIESSNGLYKIFKDKSELFTCQIEVDGAELDNTNVRLMFETKDWNIFIDGKIDRYGNVEIPIKKMSIFNEGVKGKIRMEVMADNTLFVPWEDDFEVKMSKKVTVKFDNNSKLNEKKKVSSGINVKMVK